jgi:hypothetical protein
MLRATVLSGALTAGLAAAHLTSTSPRTTGPLSFDGAKLGMTVGEWRSLAPPPGVGPAAAADCGSGIVAALREERIAATPPSPGRLTCAYGERFGDDILLHSAKFDDRYRLDGLRYRFVGGRLSEIDFSASIDAYNDIAAKLTHDYGPPATTVRDVMRTPARRFPRVRQTWRAPGGDISLTDPTDDPLRLGVRIASLPAGG